MDPQLRRYYLAAAGILLAAFAVSLFWKSPGVSAGACAGVLVSVLPFASWHALVGLAGKSGRPKSFVVGLVVVKYAVAAAVLGSLFLSGFVDPAALAAGIVAGSLAILVVAFSGTRK